MMKRIVYVIAIMGIFSMHLDAQDLFPVRQLTADPAQEGFPTWSPSGDSLIYQHTDLYDTIGRNGLWKVALDGSGALQIFSGVGEHPKWSPDGQWVVFDADTGQNIKMIAACGGVAIEFLPDTIGILHGGLPHWSPDASKIAFVEGSTTTLCVYDMESGQLKGIYQEDGLVPLPGGWTVDGKQVLVALMEMPTRHSTIWTVPLDGSDPKQITGHCVNFYRHLALSPDGSLLVYGCMEGGTLGLYIMHTGRQGAEEGESGAGEASSLPLVVATDSHNQGPIWSPDGTKIAFISGRSGHGDIYVMDLDVDALRKKLNLATEN
jgi:Tol biopolymer transport system component